MKTINQWLNSYWEKRKKFHFYCFTFQGVGENGQIIISNWYEGFKYRYITKGMIEEMKELAKLKGVHVLLNVSHLGYMTKPVFLSLNNKTPGEH